MMKRAVRFAALLVFWGCAVLAAGAGGRAFGQPADTRHLYVLGTGPGGDAAVDRLAVLLTEPFVRLTPDADLQRVLADDADAVLLVIDGARSEVRRQRARDVTPLVRAIDAPEPSPYQLAFVAAEMLPLEGPALPAEPTSAQPKPLHGLLRFQGGGSNALAGVSPLLELGAALGVAVHLPEARALEVELGAALGRGQRRSFGEDGELRVARTRVGVRVGLSQRVGRTLGALAAELGVSHSRASLGGGPEQARRSVFAALRAEGRVLIGPRWGFHLSGAVGAQGSRHAFEVAGTVAARERRYYAEAQLGLLVLLGSRDSVHPRGGLE